MSDTPLKIPSHVAIIMDGNGRWAEARGLSRYEGHQAGTENLRRVIRAAADIGIQYLTVYAFSTENWGRPRDEVDGLMMLLESTIDNELEELIAEGVQIRHLGRLESMPEALAHKVEHSIDATKENHRIVLNIAWNYGGRDEIVYAIQHLIEEHIPPGEVTEQMVSDHLFTGGIPDPDLVVRTSGEYRISNFMIWQSAYAEWYFTPVLWPDFDKEELEKAIAVYSRRERRFGKISGGNPDVADG